VVFPEVLQELALAKYSLASAQQTVTAVSDWLEQH